MSKASFSDSLKSIISWKKIWLIFFDELGNFKQKKFDTFNVDTLKCIKCIYVHVPMGEKIIVNNQNPTVGSLLTYLIVAIGPLATGYLQVGNFLKWLYLFHSRNYTQRSCKILCFLQQTWILQRQICKMDV